MNWFILTYEGQEGGSGYQEGEGEVGDVMDWHEGGMVQHEGGQVMDLHKDLAAGYHEEGLELDCHEGGLAVGHYEGEGLGASECHEEDHEGEPASDCHDEAQVWGYHEGAPEVKARRDWGVPARECHEAGLAVGWREEERGTGKAVWLTERRGREPVGGRHEGVGGAAGYSAGESGSRVGVDNWGVGVGGVEAALERDWERFAVRGERGCEWGLEGAEEGQFPSGQSLSPSQGAGIYSAVLELRAELGEASLKLWRDCLS